MQEANPEVRDLWYWKGRILYTEFVQSKVHSHICSFFGRTNDAGNRINRNYSMECEYDVNQSFGEAKKAPDVVTFINLILLRLWERYNKFIWHQVTHHCRASGIQYKFRTVV
jgi:hypothetical protein